MKKTNKILSVLLAVVMLFSAMSVSLCASAFTAKPEGLWADPATGLIQGTVTNGTNTANKINAFVLMNFLDEILKEKGKKMELDLKVTKLTIDLTSVDGLLGTIDMVKSVSGILKSLSGSLKKLNVSNWTEGQTRAKTGDLAILNNLFQFIDDNRDLVGDVVDGSFKLGRLGLIDVDDIVKSAAGLDTSKLIQSLVKNDDGLYGFIKAAVAKAIYPYEIKNENGEVTGTDPALKAKYDAAIKKNFDNILLEDGLGYGLNGLLKQADEKLKALDNEVINTLYSTGFHLEGLLDGYKYDEKKNLDATLAQIADIIYQANKGYLQTLLVSYGARLQAAITENEYSAPFASLLKFDKFTADSDYSFLNFTSTGSVKGLNVFVGQIIKGVTTYTGWSTKYNLGGNFTRFVKWALTNIDTKGTPYEGYDFSGNNEEVALALAKMIVNITVKEENVKATLNSCTTTQEVITKLVPELCKSNEKIVIGKKSTTWERVLGDIAGSFLADYAVLYTNTSNTSRYVKGSSKGIWDVLNYAANYYLVDLNFDTLFGCSMTKSESFLAKLDKLQAKVMAGLEYSKASVLIPKVLNAVFSLDFNTIVGEGVEKAFTNINTSVSAANLAYTLIDNVFKGIVGQSVFATDKFVSLDAIIQNKNLGITVEKLLNGLNKRKSSLLPVILYVFSALDADSVFTVKAGTDGSVTVRYAGKTLVKGTDYTVTASVKEKGVSAKLTIKGKGNYAGTVTTVSKCSKHVYDSGVVTNKATTSKNGTYKYTCTLCGKTKTSTIYYAKTFSLSNTSYTYTGKSLKPSVTVKDSKGKTLKSGTDYTVKYSSDTKNVGTVTVTVTLKGKYTGTKKLTYKILPKQVTGLKASSIKTTSLKLTWSKVTGAKYYKVEMSTDGKKWKTVKTVSTNSLTVSKLKSGTKYQFRVTALDSTKKLAGKASSVLKTGTLTGAPSVTLKSSKSKTATASWKKVTGAAKYVVYKSTDGKKWTKVTTTTKTSYTLTKLTGGKKVYVKVTALNAYGVASAYSSVKSVTVKK
ncbi:MAG: fibronectin type III domain-containing protein [Acutalibacteraceae bacterium]